MRGLIIIAIILSGFVSSSAQVTLYYNGNIFTSDQSLPVATYFVVENGFITKTGSRLDESDLKKYANQVNLQSKTVIPGIIDSHLHFIDAGLNLLQTSFSNSHDRLSLIEKIKSTKNELLDGIYIGRDLGHEVLKAMEKPKDLLDSLMPETPAIIFLKSGHAAIVNSVALKKLGFTSTSTITDGTIQKDISGNLTGLLMEGASMEASRQISSIYSSETIERAILKVQSNALCYGITTIGDNTFSPYFFKIYQQLQKEDLLKIRVRARSYGRIPETEGLMKSVGKKHMGFIGGGVDETRVKYHAMKFFEDQSLSLNGHSHDMVEPGGNVFLSPDQLADIFQLHPVSTFAFHVQGKKGLQNILDAVKANEKKVSRQRHVLDHAGYASGEQIKEAADLGLGLTIIASQLFDYENLSSFYKTHAPADQPFDERELLDTRMKYEMAKGALTSDYPYGMDTVFIELPEIDGLNPFPLMAVNVTGRYPDGTLIHGVGDKTLTVSDAVQAYTTNGAYVLMEETQLGKIAPGFHADFVVMENDILSTDPIELYQARVEQTFVSGALVFDSSHTTNAVRAGKTIPVSPSDYAISPVIGYDPALGMILGGAYFNFPLKTPGQYFDFQIQAITSGKINLQSNYSYFNLLKNMNLNFSGSYSNFFQYYFGEGDETNADTYVKLFSNNYRVKPEIAIQLKKKFQLIAFGDARGRREIKVTDQNDVEINTSFFPNENSLAFGLTSKYDTRDNTFSTKKGTLMQATLQYIPEALNVKGLGDVGQVQAEIRHFTYVINSNFVIASRLAAGYSSGTSSYLFRYSLGGSYALRGYYSNRFRGEKYYVVQLEGRFPIYRRFSGVAFIDAGDITDQALDKPKYTYGTGMRFALSQNIKLRLDYGIGRDQTGVFFTFSEAF
jgi:predicted amidohydrolase YtcJ